MTFLQAIFFAIIQGVSELFPVSSLGHAVILPAVLGWHVDQDLPQFLPFLVVLHLGTATALLIYFWRVWWSLFRALIGLTDRTAENRHLIKLLIIGTLPAVVLGFVFEHKLRHLFGSPVAAAVFLILNGFILFAGERLRRRALRAADRRELGDANWRDAVVVGFCQTLRFSPGFRAREPLSSVVFWWACGTRMRRAFRSCWLLRLSRVRRFSKFQNCDICRSPAAPRQ